MWERGLEEEEELRDQKKNMIQHEEGEGAAAAWVQLSRHL